MQVSVEVLEGLERRLTIELPAARIDEEVQKRLQKMKGQVRLHGFRPGKVPFKLVKGRFGRSVRDEVTGELIRDSYVKALDQEDLTPVGVPNIDASPVQEGEDLKYLATFEVYPVLELTSVESFEIQRPLAEVNEEDIDKMLERLRKQRLTWTSVDRAAADGDRVTMDFVGTIGGEEFEGGKGSDAPVVLGSGSLMPGFESGLEGMKAGEEKAIKLNFPDDYHVDDLKGQEANFQVSVKEVAESQLPELDEDFISGFGVEEGGVEALRGELRRNMEAELHRGTRTVLKQQVMEKLLGANQVELPKTLVDNEIRNLAEQAGVLKKTEGETPPELSEETIERFGDQARKRVSLGLIVSELVRTAGIEVDQHRVNAHVDAMSATYDEPDQVRNFYRSNSRAMDSVRATVLEDQVVDWVLERAQVSVEPKSFEAVLNPEKGNS